MSYRLLKEDERGAHVLLDSGHHVRVCIHIRMLNTGALSLIGNAELIDEHGEPICDGNGHPVATGFGHTMSVQDSTDEQAVARDKRDVALVLLGEPPVNEMWRHELHANAHKDANIRTNIDAMVFTGAARSLFALLGSKP